MSEKFSGEAADQIILELIRSGSIRVPEVNLQELLSEPGGCSDGYAICRWIALFLKRLKSELMQDLPLEEVHR